MIDGVELDGDWELSAVQYHRVMILELFLETDDRPFYLQGRLAY